MPQAEGQLSQHLCLSACGRSKGANLAKAEKVARRITRQISFIIAHDETLSAELRTQFTPVVKIVRVIVPGEVFLWKLKKKTHTHTFAFSLFLPPLKRGVTFE